MEQENHRRTVLITGASKGLGKELAFEFARNNFTIVLCSRNSELLKINCDLIRANGGNATYIPCDVTNSDEVDTAIEHTIRSFGRIDIAVFNAGIGGSTTFDEFDASVFDNVMKTNFLGVAHGISLVANVMTKQHFGTIVGISSLNDSHPIPGGSSYVASKKALNVILEAASIELEPYGVHVITVRPGFIQTDMVSKNTLYMPLMMKPGKAARIIVRGILKGRSRISFPFPMVVLSAFGKIVPSLIWKFIFRSRA
jgi:NAD(P)-dependent dehydrogenase (short-subunit alcohol dehydrogenase family)